MFTVPNTAKEKSTEEQEKKKQKIQAGKECMESMDYLDYAIVYIPYLLVEVKSKDEILEIYHQGNFPYKKALSMLKIAQIHRRNRHHSIFDNLLVKTCAPHDSILMDRGTLHYFEQLEYCILEVYRCKCSPEKSFSVNRYSGCVLNIVKIILGKKDWPPDFFS